MRPKTLIPLLALSLGAFLLTSCQEDLQPEVDRLNTELTDLKKELERERERYRAEQKSSRELHRQVRELEQEKKRAESDMRDLERDLANYRKREEEELAEEEAKPDADELKAAAKEEAKGAASARVTISGDQNSGFGVLVEADGKTWIYLPPAVLSGNSRLEITQADGTPLKKFGSFEILGNGTLARLEITEEVGKAVTLEGANEIKSSAYLVSVDPSGSVSEGRAYSVKPEMMSTDSKTRSLPVGSLIFLADGSGLIAMLVPESTKGRDLWPNAYRDQRAPRTMALRLDQTGDWTQIAIGSFLEEARVLDAADRFTRLVSAITAIQPGSGGTSDDLSVGGRMTVKEVFKENQDLSVVRTFQDLDEWLEKNGERAADQDIQKRVSRAYDEIRRTAAKETEALTSRSFSPYHTEAAKQSIEWRKAAVEDLSRAAASATE